MEVALPAVIKDDGRTVTEAQYALHGRRQYVHKIQKIRQNETQNVELNQRLFACITCMQHWPGSSVKRL